MPIIGGGTVYRTPSTPGKAPPGTTDNGDGTFTLSDGTRMKYDNTGNIVKADAPTGGAGAGQTAPMNYAGLNPAAWQSGPGMMGAPSGTADIDKQIADLKNQMVNAPYRPGDPHLDRMNDQLAALEKQRAAIVQRDQTDAMQAVIRMRQAEERKAPTIDRTVIQETNPDFSDANNTLAGAQDFRWRQLQQADALRRHDSDAGQRALIDKLNNEIAGTGGPSVAKLQLDEGRDAAINDAASIANSARGNTMGIAQIEALRSSERSIQDAARSAALLRATEVAKAREELAGVLGTQRGQGIQEENVAGTLYGQGRGQDIQTAGVQSQNALSAAQIAQATRLAQANLDDGTKRANLEAYFKQLGMNDAMVQYWSDRYTHYKERPEDLAIDYEKTRQGIIRDNTDRQTAAEMRRDDQRRQDQAAAMNAVSSGGMTLLQGFAKSQQQQPSSGGGGVGGGAPGTPQQQYPNAYNAGLATENPYKYP